MTSYDQSLSIIDVYIPFNDLRVDGKKIVDIIILVSIFVYFSKKGSRSRAGEAVIVKLKLFFTHNKNIKIHTQA